MNTYDDDMQHPLFQDRLSCVLRIVHDFVWENIVKTEKGHALTVVAKDAVIASVRDVIDEKFMIPYELLDETARIIVEQDWNHLNAQHYVAKLVALRALQLTGLDFPENLYVSNHWLHLTCKQFLKLRSSDDLRCSPIYKYLLDASNDVEDHESKKKILARTDKTRIWQRAQTIISEAQEQYANAEACSYVSAQSSEPQDFPSSAAA